MLDEIIEWEEDIAKCGTNINMPVNIKLTTDLVIENLNRVIKLARFNDVVKRLKKGLKTNVMERGVSLSGGEKQRLALARGLLAARDSEIILMDEPTSSVDAENELIIYQNIFSQLQAIYLYY